MSKNKKRPSLTREQRATIGTSIPDSNLVRDYCIHCGEAMRVTRTGGNTCLDCRPTGIPGSTSSTITSGNIEYHGGRFHSAEW
jgi:hypothetical protein